MAQRQTGWYLVETNKKLEIAYYSKRVKSFLITGNIRFYEDSDFTYISPSPIDLVELKKALDKPKENS